MKTVVRKKTPKKVPVQRKKKSKNGKKLSPLHPVSQSQYVREERPPTPLMEFILSAEGEGIEYLELVREFQNEWCEHPKGNREVSATMYEPNKDRYEHTLKCLDCGKLLLRAGRAPSAGSR